MNCVGFLILLVLILFCLSCKGEVSREKKEFIFGSTGRLERKFEGKPTVINWYFTQRGIIPRRRNKLAYKGRGMKDFVINTTILPGVVIEPPATLVLKNVDERYNGIYKFQVQGTVVNDYEAEFDVYIVEKPNITSFTVAPHPVAIEGQKVAITCISKGVPSSNNTIKRNGTKVNVSTEKTSTQVTVEKTSTTYTIDSVKQDDAGIYTCIAENKIGNDSATVNLTVKVKTTNDDGDKDGLSAGAIAGIAIGALALIVIIVVVVYCCKPKENRCTSKTETNHALENVNQSHNVNDTEGPVDTTDSKSNPSTKVTTPIVNNAVNGHQEYGTNNKDPDSKSLPKRMIEKIYTMW